MKLNKKLLTAALAGALVVTAVPAGTFAEKNSAENSYTEELNLTKEQAAARMDELAKQIAELSARRAAIVTQEWEAGQTSEGLIEKLQKKKQQLKKLTKQQKLTMKQQLKLGKMQKTLKNKLD